jgi:hypothetical protein
MRRDHRSPHRGSPLPPTARITSSTTIASASEQLGRPPPATASRTRPVCRPRDVVYGKVSGTSHLRLLGTAVPKACTHAEVRPNSRRSGSGQPFSHGLGIGANRF